MEPDERRGSDWYEPLARRAEALRYGVSAAVVAAVTTGATGLMTRVPAGPPATDLPDAVMVDLTPALASSQPKSDAPDGERQEATPAAPVAPPPPPPKPLEDATTDTPPPEAPNPAAVVEKKEEVTPPPPPPPPPAAAEQPAQAPSGADDPKSEIDEGAAPAAAPDAHAITAWQRAMVGRLEAAKHRNPHHQHLSGTVDVAFRIDRAGHVTGSAVKRSSGSDALDAAALALVAAAAPFPRPPPGLGDDGLSFTVPVRFNPRH